MTRRVRLVQGGGAGHCRCRRRRALLTQGQLVVVAVLEARRQSAQDELDRLAVDSFNTCREPISQRFVYSHNKWFFNRLCCIQQAAFIKQEALLWQRDCTTRLSV